MGSVSEKKCATAQIMIKSRFSIVKIKLLVQYYFVDHSVRRAFNC